MSAGSRSLRQVARTVLAALAGTAVAFVSGATAAPTELPQQRGVVDLLAQANVRIDGAPGSAAGRSLAAAGDVNGDGIDDVVIGAPTATYVGSTTDVRSKSGAAYVVFGRSTMTRIDLASLGTGGFRIVGAFAGDNAGLSVSGAGDVNGDGRDDVIVGAPRAGNNGRSASGSAYVVFGKTSTATVDLKALGNNGFRIDGANATDWAGDSVAGAGDVNGDGRADVVVGAFYENSAYVVFGGASSATVDLRTLGARGFEIDGPTNLVPVAGAGDVNGDGRADVVVGGSNAAYVVFGKASTTSVTLGSLGSGGFRIAGATSGDQAGDSVAGAGDVNGDGRADVVVGAPYRDDGDGRADTGAAYVVFGKASAGTVSLASLGAGGYRIDGAATGDRAGTSVAGAGDVNGDGRADVVVGAPFADNNGRSISGSAYVVFGKSSTTSVDLARLGARGFRMDGARASDQAGASVAGSADVNGDGRKDVLAGAPNGAGAAFVVYGFGEPRLEYRPLLARVGTAIKPHAPSTLARTGTATFSVSPQLPDGLRLTGLGVITGTPTRAQLRSTHRVTMRDLVGKVTADLSITVSVAPGSTPPPPPPPPETTPPPAAPEPQLAYRPLRAQVGRAIQPHAPSRLVHTGTPVFTVSPPLPKGLRLTGLGVISGTPTQAQPPTTHRVTMRDLVGRVTADLVITVSAAPGSTPPPPPPPGTTPPPGDQPPDARAPRLTVRAPSPQQARQGFVRVRVSCDEGCRLRASGRIRVGRSTIRLVSASASLGAPGTKALRLRMTKAGTKRLQTALRRGVRAQATITVRAIDATGNTSSKARNVTLR